jgi:hypothetical protein
MAHPDLQALFDSQLQFTKKLLGKQGGFNPWASTMSSTGQIQWVAASNGEEFGRLASVTTLASYLRGNPTNPTLSAAVLSTYLARHWTSSCRTRKRPTAFTMLKCSLYFVIQCFSYPPEHNDNCRNHALMPRMIRMPFQNRERPVNLLQQHDSRQFMRQRHLPE